MTGFDAEAISREFFPDGRHRVLVAINIGKPAEEGAWFDRLPRLGYDEVVETLALTAVALAALGIGPWPRVTRPLLPPAAPQAGRRCAPPEPTAPGSSRSSTGPVPTSTA